MPSIRLSTELPIAADAAFALAQKVDLFKFVVAPVLRLPRADMPEILAPGADGSGRLWWFGVIPAWTHHIRLVEIGENEMYTNEHGGPVHTWNHRLTFEPLTATSCRYTDEIEIDGGLRGLATRAFVHLIFRHRHRRWRSLAQVLA